jgi:hypothetical protein
MYNLSINPASPKAYDLHGEENSDTDKQKDICEGPIQFDLHDELSEETIEDIPDKFQEMTTKTEKLLWHYCLGHT